MVASDDEYSRALAYATSALDLLRRGRIPPYPRFYELLYTYASGTDPRLNARINALFAQGQPPGQELAEQLYSEFLAAQEASERISAVSRRMSEGIDAVNAAVGMAASMAGAYEATLKGASEELDRAAVPDALQDVVRRLMAETLRMQETNSRLERTLRASREDLVALQRDMAEIRRESLLDPLTKIFNRTCFDQGLVRAIDEARASGDPLSLVMLDIDYFKNFNDSFGHQTGDQVLRLVAMTIKSNTKGRDLAARYGGEEFAAILPATGLVAAMAVAENIRRAIHAKELLKRSTNEKLGRITASCGVASLQPADTAASFIERADRCLYAAKSAGRNCVVSETELEDRAA